MEIKPLRDQVVLQPISKEEKTESGIVIPDTADEEKPEQGEVVAVGPGKRLPEDGDRQEPDVEEGDRVLFTKYGPSEVSLDGEDYLVAKEEDILAILE